MKILIAGFGSIGRRHFRNLLELGGQDILFLRSHKSTLEDSELEGYLVETDIESALAHEPDGVVTANQTSYHLDVAIPAASQGCHILLEKPVSDSMERVEEFSRIVKDSGSGIDMADPNVIFEPFYTTKVTGVGLGLANVKRIIKEHKGDITVRNAEDCGVEMRISLPLSS